MIFGLPLKESRQCNSIQWVSERACGFWSPSLIFFKSAKPERDDLFEAGRYSKACKLDYLNMDFDDGDLKELWDTDLDAVSLRDKPIEELSAFVNCFHMFRFPHLADKPSPWLSRRVGENLPISSRSELICGDVTNFALGDSPTIRNGRKMTMAKCSSWWSSLGWKMGKISLHFRLFFFVPRGQPQNEPFDARWL